MGTATRCLSWVKSCPDASKASLPVYPGQQILDGRAAVTVQNISGTDGGKAVVGNFTQHANVIVSDKGPAQP
jgi:hypothetical protein